ncbi:MAG: PP2C family protein-serine/threonine phosphatase [Longimicrobiales bacterium]
MPSTEPVTEPGPPRGPIELWAFGRSHLGRRRADNQDDFLIIADLSAPADHGYTLRPDAGEDGVVRDGRFLLGPKGALLLVADGMGGPGGSVASRIASTCIQHELASSWATEAGASPERFATLLRRAIEQANARIRRQTQDNIELDGMGSTATAVGVLGDFLYIGQVGDSRAYLVREGVPFQLTRDQTIVQAMIDAGTLTPEDAETSRHRTTLLQALGTAIDVGVDLTVQQLCRGDVLVLCSDGLSRTVRADEIAGIVSNTEDVIAACDALVDLANARGGPDNITAVVARLIGPGLESATPDRVIERTVLVLPEP